ncbi:hypothetical protein CROQUDRAFT_671435 [Cronartium quercuum f. sp. fusiforme G11]|uniref:LisH domain-containing protein n=1 Tax=Cronartium quercuum f. sp. fusiforme G11 TaxID=708437 RepID=A0A9P6TB62_9BASI|nr:hypothetical protein CROQUDRAFT_671435 [Cronartium quercuum f. sp. fusiforme G11]
MRPPPPAQTHSPAILPSTTNSSSPNSPPKTAPTIHHMSSQSTPSQSASPPLGFPRPSHSPPELGVWQGDYSLNSYIHDYLSKRGFLATAEKLVEESGMDKSAGWATNKLLNAPQGLLYEWWTIFWEVFLASSGKSGHPEANMYSQIAKASRSDCASVSASARLSAAGLTKIPAPDRPSHQRQPDPAGNPDSDFISSTSSNTCSNASPNVARPYPPMSSDSINITHRPGGRLRSNVPTSSSPNFSGPAQSGESAVNLSPQAMRLRTAPGTSPSAHVASPATSACQPQSMQQHANHEQLLQAQQQNQGQQLQQHHQAQQQAHQAQRAQQAQQQAQQQPQHQQFQLNTSANGQSQRPPTGLMMAPPPHPTSFPPRPSTDQEKEALSRQALINAGLHGRDLSSLTNEERDRVTTHYTALAQHIHASQVQRALATARAASYSSLADPRALPSHPSLYRDPQQLSLQQQQERQVGAARAAQLQQPQAPLMPPHGLLANLPGRPQSQNSVITSAAAQQAYQNGAQNGRKRPLTPAQNSSYETPPAGPSTAVDINGPSPSNRKRTKTTDAPSPAPSPRMRMTSGSMSANGTSVDTRRAMEMVSSVSNSQPMAHEPDPDPQRSMYQPSKSNHIPTPASTPNPATANPLSSAHPTPHSTDSNPSGSRQGLQNVFAHLGSTRPVSDASAPPPPPSSISSSRAPSFTVGPNGIGGVVSGPSSSSPAPNGFSNHPSQPSTSTSAAGLDFSTMTNLFGVPEPTGTGTGTGTGEKSGEGDMELELPDGFDFASLFKDTTLWADIV